VKTFFRIQPRDRDPDDLLKAEVQSSEPWDGAVKGTCDKCADTGQTWHDCASCEENGPTDDCPSCHGERRYKDTCPACEGTGEITDAKRRGVSVFPDEDGLYRYMISRGADIENCVVVELEGIESEDEDFDADEGALLVVPKRIVETRPVDRDRVGQVRRDAA
jgi:DnaJ-class molecular chaperone